MQENEQGKDGGPSTEKKKGRKAAAVATVKPAEVVKAPEEWPDVRIKLLRDTIAKGSTPGEFELAMQVIKRTGLDPFARQIYFVSRYDSKEKRNVMTWQFSIDGFRLISQRTGKYRGMVGPFWCGDDGVWKDVWLKPEPPAAAKVGILHADFSEPVWGVATWRQYVVTDNGGAPTFMWRKMGPTMLAKCAESLARRIAFPQELSGLYTDDEMAQAKHGDPIDLAQTNYRAETLAKDVTPPKSEAPQAENPAQAAAMADDREREAESSGFTTANTKTSGETSGVDPEREAKVLTTIEKWKKTAEGKDAMSICLRLGYGSKSQMYEAFEKCECDFENFYSWLRDEWKKKQGEGN